MAKTGTPPAAAADRGDATGDHRLLGLDGRGRGRAAAEIVGAFLDRCTGRLRFDAELYDAVDIALPEATALATAIQDV